jgi:hypothetical protein
MFRGPGLAKVGKLFEIGQVVAEIADHWLSEKLSGAAYWSCRHKKSRDYERCGFRSCLKSILFAWRMDIQIVACRFSPNNEWRVEFIVIFGSYVGFWFLVTCHVRGSRSGKQLGENQLSPAFDDGWPLRPIYQAHPSE